MYIYTYPSHVMDTGMHVQTEHIAQTSEVPKSRTHIYITRILGPQVDAEHQHLWAWGTGRRRLAFVNSIIN